jgi:hypothetical protein
MKMTLSCRRCKSFDFGDYPLRTARGVVQVARRANKNIGARITRAAFGKHVYDT